MNRMIRGSIAFLTLLLALLSAGPVWADDAAGVLEQWTSDPTSRERLERQFDLVRPGARPGGAAVDTRFAPLPGGTDTAAQLAQGYPAAARAEAQAVFARLLALYPQVEQRHGIPRYDLAGAVATFIAGAYTGYSGVAVDDQEFVAIVRQMRQAIGVKPEFAAASARDKQSAYEQLAILALLTLSTHEALEKDPDVPGAAQIRANMKQASKAYLESLLGIDADQVRVSAQGVTTGAHGALQSAPAQAGKAQPASAPVGASRAADIDAVVLVQGYSMTGVGGAILLKYSPAVLYGDGSYSKDARRALQGDARIDGRWHRNGGGWALTDQKGKTTQVKASMRALPAGRGSRLQGSYRSLGGVGAPGQDVAVVSAWSAMQFARDGSVQMGQGAGATTDTVVTGAKGSNAARYELDGHVITLIFADGRREQRLFYFLPGKEGQQAIGVGASTLSMRR